MSRIIIIGGSGHIGSYLVPTLVTMGHEVVNVSRGISAPYRAHSAWEQVESVILDRTAEEAKGEFGTKIAALQPDIVVDMISFDLPSMQQLVETLHGKIDHYLFCSTIWVYGSFTTIPSTEADLPNPIEPYGRNKAEMEAWLEEQARRRGFPATSFRPGHIVGEGWLQINPLGNLNPEAFSKIARGEELVLPNLGLEMMHHVHADDVARWILCAIHHRQAAIGEAFNTVSEQALTLKGYTEAMYRWFGQQPRLSFQPFDEWLGGMSEQDAAASRGHVIRSSCHSIEKSRQRLGYHPRYSSLEAIQQAVQVLITKGKVTVPASK